MSAPLSGTALRQHGTLLPPAKEVMFSLRLFVCLFVSRITQKLLYRIFTKFGKKVARKRHFGGNPDHVTLELG